MSLHEKTMSIDSQTRIQMAGILGVPRHARFSIPPSAGSGRKQIILCFHVMGLPREWQEGTTCRSQMVMDGLDSELHAQVLARAVYGDFRRKDKPSDPSTTRADLDGLDLFQTPRPKSRPSCSVFWQPRPTWCILARDGPACNGGRAYSNETRRIARRYFLKMKSQTPVERDL